MDETSLIASQIKPASGQAPVKTCRCGMVMDGDSKHGGKLVFELR